MQNEQEHKAIVTAKVKKLRYKKVAIGVFIAVVLGASGTFLYLQSRPKTPLDTHAQKVSFTLYYPKVLPTGYTYKKDSARAQPEGIFFTLTSADGSIYISEQKAPVTTPDLEQIPGFRKVNTFIGQSAIGKNNEKPTGILITTSSILTITGDTTTSDDAIAKILEAMTPIYK